MLEGNLVLSLLNIVFGLSCLAVGLSVFTSGPRTKATRAFLLLTSLYALGGGIAFLLLNAQDEDLALSLARWGVFNAVIALALQFHLITVLPLDRKDPGGSNPSTYLALAAALAFLPAFLLDEVAATPYGWGLTPSLGTVVFAAAALWFVLITINRMLRLERGATKVVRAHLSLLVLAVLVPFLIIMADIVLALWGLEMAPVLTGGFAVASLLFAKVMFGSKEDGLGEGAGTENSEDLLPSEDERGEDGCVMVEAKGSEGAHTLFKRATAEGRKGLIITREHPDRVRSEHGIDGSTIIWLATQPGPDRIDPTSLSMLQHTLVEFLQANPSAVILLDGLEYLLSENTPDKVLRMVYSIRDAVTISRSTLLVPIDPLTMDDRERALFEREFKVVRQ